DGELRRRMWASEGREAHLQGRDLLGGAGESPRFGLLALSVENHEAQRARELIAAYNAALPLPFEEPEGFAGVLVC
ncbi:DUF2007 domain-containing protein, partial [Pseudomonas sp. KCJK8993]|uniref:DUF2007 domain-containing protein n=1 Tax=Pseudomonas sp. KCJK8993 TaxID=3344565 RepID=UPI0039068BB3